MSLKQLTLAKKYGQGHLRSLRHEDYFVSSSNQEIYENIINRKWIGQSAIILGEKKTGKTHLARLWIKQFGARDITKNIDPANLLNGNCLIEDIERLCKKDELESLLHCYNTAAESKNLLLLTTNDLDFAAKLPDLSSRVFSTQTFKIKPPDNDLLQVIIAKCFYARQVRVPVKTIEFITNNIERSIKSAIRFVEYIDEKALEQRKKISIKLVKKCIDSAFGTKV